MKKLLLLLCLVPWQAWAATKYVGPSGAAAWASCVDANTLCSITTAQTNAVAGDIVILTNGTYSEGINTNAAGSAGNPIIWRAATAKYAILDGYASGQTDRVILADADYNTFDGIAVSVQVGAGATTYGLYVSGSNTVFTNGEISYIKNPASVVAVDVTCANMRALTTLTNNFIHNCTYGAYLFGPAAGHASQVTGNVVSNMDVGIEEDSDCFAMSGNASYDWTGALIDNNDCSGWRDDGFDAFTQDNMTVTNNRFTTPLDNVKDNTSCLKMGYEASSGVIARRNSCLGLGVNGNDYGSVVTGASNAVLEANIFSGTGNTGIEVAQRNAAGGANNTIQNNTVIGFTVNGVRVSTGATGTVLYNNVFGGDLAALGDINVNPGLTATGKNNLRVHGTVAGGGTYNQTNDINGDPSFVGGTSPATAAGFRAACGSPLIAAGTPLGGLKDYGNRRFGVKPSIGAWEHASGDARCTVTAR